MRNLREHFLKEERARAFGYWPLTVGYAGSERWMLERVIEEQPFESHEFTGENEGPEENPPGPVSGNQRS
jgi:hypothetical protein